MDDGDYDSIPVSNMSLTVNYIDKGKREYTVKTNTDLPQMTGKLYYSTESEIAVEGFFK